MTNEKKYSYIKIDEDFANLISQLDQNINLIEVKGESVKYLFNTRAIITKILESMKTEEELFSSKKEE